ncbi:hypothetical protein M3J09_003875 [Ascochyta lentis]
MKQPSSLFPTGAFNFAVVIARALLCCRSERLLVTKTRFMAEDGCVLPIRVTSLSQISSWTTISMPGLG